MLETNMLREFHDGLIEAYGGEVSNRFFLLSELTALVNSRVNKCRLMYNLSKTTICIWSQVISMCCHLRSKPVAVLKHEHLFKNPCLQYQQISI